MFKYPISECESSSGYFAFEITLSPPVLITKTSCYSAHSDASLRPDRFALAVGSAVFDAMFNGGMATTSTEIELPDVEPAAFLALLK